MTYKAKKQRIRVRIIAVKLFKFGFMNWDDIPGQQFLKIQLQKSIEENRVSHAQLFAGAEGYGTLPLALAYAKEIFLRENPHAASKVEHLNHLDLHFSFPVYTEKKTSLSKTFFPQFREMLLDNPYSSLQHWNTLLDSENKQLFISAEEIEEQNSKFALRSFEGGTKILIIWRADKMNAVASNKFLKFLEEPPEKTIIILTAESTEDMLPTILSRTQIVDVPRPSDEDLSNFLSAETKDEQKIREAVLKAQGDLNIAKAIIAEQDNGEFENLYVQWVRYAVQVKKKPETLRFIVLWARNIATWNREKQKSFLDYCSEMFRLALLQNYSLPQMVYKKIEANNFRWNEFTAFVNGGNIQSIINELNDASYHLQRNANARVVWTDLGIKLSRYLHKTK